ncbi:MAG: cupredoxin domain-containing protein [Magnetococcales bacterium]|nr:cupredoxin domain-containing protein [Magnetococcales bacterium]
MHAKIANRIALTLALTLAAANPGFAAEDYVVNSAEIVKAADWKNLEKVTVTLDEFSYQPKKLVFKEGKAYQLILKNAGEKKHYFTAPEFYKAIATRKIQSNKDGEIKAPYLLAVELMVGGQLDLYFVPAKKGTYPVYCTIDDHQKQGMEGQIVIE